MTNTNEIIRDLGIRLIRAEIKARQPKDVRAVEDAISTRIRIDNIGNVFVVDKSGQRDDAKSFEQFMDEVSNDRPELFHGRPPSTGGSSSNTTDNPFMKGPSFNVTKQMALLKTNPTEAHKLAWDAGSPIRN